MAHKLLGETLEILADLIAFESVSRDSNLDLIAYVNQRLDQIGTRTYLTLDPTGTKANLFATLGPPEMDGGIVLSGHTDVVPVDGQEWSSDPFTATIRAGKLFGRGACDMKGFLACALAYAPHFAERELKRPLHMAFTYDEEEGCLGAQVMLKELQAVGRKPALCIVGEPTMMKIIEGHKGCCEYTTSFSGLEGHGSVPDRGVNAVEYAVRFVSKLLETGEALKSRAPEGSRFDPPWSTIQIGKMAGGIARNIIAGSCSVDWELRTINTADFDFTHEQVKAYVEDELLPRMRHVHPEAEIVTQVIGEVVGLEPMSDSEAVTLVRALTGNNDDAECVSFNTEAGLYQQLGVDAVICGPGSIEQAHKPDEFIELSQLSACLEMIENLEPRLS
ncbi:acetylornithine deacetylase [Pelagibacterium xiamenense]|uniref:acetylornithine deacetylase n=1 Tax=Pelagibacterium xiamenense TaxID=2901140 RepID=UPI001E4D719F|nr:acetylornithine deacetylase [Pelagibacterium xiamenense]MCD7059375.1 acetylornithine deacetylase [Pelagibacterium xiamenense]